MTPEEFTDAITTTVMPFGKYEGRPLYDLPLDYLLWFEQKGYPKGKLGGLMKAVADAKAECGNAIFDPLRPEPFSPGSRRDKKKHWKFRT
ncbi:MAG: DUF3820 family protein [Verrucomicrobiota bacterium]